MKSNINKKTIMQCGMFDSERFWRPKDLAVLPSITDKEGIAIVKDMDELFFLFCKKKDILLTKKKFNKTYKSYLTQIGYDFTTIDLDHGKANENIFENIVLDSSFLKDSVISPFAVVPYLWEMAKIYHMDYDLPNLDIVTEVNSKLYSYNMIKKLGLKSYGMVIQNIEDFERAGLLLKSGSILIKDVYGVSGKGNMAISSQAILKRIINNYKKQIMDQQKSLCVIIEPLLNKRTDFSCQLFIHKNGEINFLSIQVLRNEYFSYKGTESAEGCFIQYIEEHKYFSIMKQCCRLLYSSGYYGDVCIDSMVLADGEIVPIIEINARKSMSLLKYSLDIHLKKYKTEGNLQQIVFISNMHITIDMLIDKLSANGVLFTGAKGIMPLSANTLDTNFCNNGIKYKGRLYYSAIAENKEEKSKLVKKLKEIIYEAGVKKMS